MANDAQVGLPARRQAARLLDQVLHEGRHFDDIFRSDGNRGSMKSFTQRDRALVRNLVATTLRRAGQIEDAVSRYLKRPLPKSARSARVILALGAAQILFLNVPPHAAIDLAVRCADLDRRARNFKGLINAVLRRVSENTETILAGQDAAVLNTPAWMWKRWRKAYGDTAARAISEAHLHEPSLDISVKQDPETWATKLGGHLLPTGTIRLISPGRIDALEGFSEGAWWVQDAAAALPMKLLGDVRGKRVLDMCAAPGGKTLQLATQGAHVTAIDRSAGRLEMIRENLARLSLNADLAEADALAYRPEKPPDLILLDAPCTATGTIRRHPDILSNRSPGDITALATMQSSLLAHAASLLPRGGRLVYCTCSLEPEEGEDQVSVLLENDPNLVRTPIPDTLALEELGPVVTSHGDLRTLPSHYPLDPPRLGGLDGFYAALLEKH